MKSKRKNIIAIIIWCSSCIICVLLLVWYLSLRFNDARKCSQHDNIIKILSGPSASPDIILGLSSDDIYSGFKSKPSSEDIVSGENYEHYVLRYSCHDSLVEIWLSRDIGDEEGKYMLRSARRVRSTQSGLVDDTWWIYSEAYFNDYVKARGRVCD